MKRPPVPTVNAIAASADVSSDEEENVMVEEKQQVGGKRQSGTVNNLKHHHSSKGPLPSPIGSAHSFDLQVRFFNSITRNCFDFFNLLYQNFKT